MHFSWETVQIAGGVIRFYIRYTSLLHQPANGKLLYCQYAEVLYFMVCIYNGRAETNSSPGSCGETHGNL